MNPRKVAVNDFQERTVVLQNHSRDKASLQTDLSGPSLLRFARTQQDLFLCEKVAVTVLERAESTTAYAFIGEVDVSVYNKGDLIFATLLPQRIG
jgi:hypothetical protein